MHFDPETLIIEHASVPDLVTGPDGALWVYYVNGEPGHHGIYASRQTKEGNWEIVGCVKLDGVFNGNAVDPNVTRLPDGRIRLVYYEGFFVGGGNPPAMDAPHPIYSAVSEDGINFTVEGLLIEVKGATDPSMIQLPDGSWLLAMTNGSETLLAASKDGRKFELTGVTVEEMGIPELALLSERRIALYLGRMFLSEDGGQTWELQPDVQLPPGADPSLTPLPDGGYAFAYKGFSDAASQPPGGPAQPPGQPGAAAETFTPCTGYGEPLEGEQSQLGPWASRLLIAFSDDGLTFTPANQILADQADVPDVLVMPDGEMRVYYVTTCPEAANQIVVAVSRDGVAWEYYKTAIDNMQGIQPIAVDPAVEFTEDGRIRLYFTSVEASPEALPQSYSAISSDGYTFEMESGARFGVEGEHVLDPNALLIGETWHYFAGGVPGSNYHATSPDGLTFTRQDDLQLDGFLFANGIPVEGGYRYYGFIQQPGSAVSAIYSAFTSDGQTWTLEDGTRLELHEENGLEKVGVKDPGVAQLPDGRYIMIYSTLIPEYPYDSPQP